MRIEDYDLAIIGGGPGGLTAGLYAARGKIRTVLFERMVLGGQAVNSYDIENYPGFERISGPELTEKMEKHARKFGLDVQMKNVTEVSLADDGRFLIVAEEEEYVAPAVILAMGANPNTLGVPGEKELFGKGISTCAVCDAAFFKEKRVAVAGGGDTAMDDSILLTKFTDDVTIIHRRDKLRATKVLQERAFKNKRIKFIWNTVIERMEGRDYLESIDLRNVETGEKSKMKLEGLFLAIGSTPNSDIVKAPIEKTDGGYIVTDDKMQTSVRGLFAIGDLRDRVQRQIVTSAGDGATAAHMAEKYLESLER